MKIVRFIILAAVVLFSALVVMGETRAQAPVASIDERIWEGLAEDGQVDVLIVFRQNADLSAAVMIPDKERRAGWVYENAVAVAVETQSHLVAELERQNIPYRQFWIINAVRARLNQAQIGRVAAMPGVARLVANIPFHGLPAPIPEPESRPDSVGPQAIDSIEWGVNRVNAPWAWDAGYTGQGIVVSGQDTGYDWDHQALVRAYRGFDPSQPLTPDHDYNWHDAIHEDIGTPNTNPCGYDSPEPCDDNSHGTHTMGTVVGNDLDPADATWPGGATNAIGVAPGAAWMACRNMDNGDGTPATYIECFEWLAAPYPIGGDAMADGDPNKAPDVINNSWSCPPSEGCSGPEIEATMNAAVDAGILVVVSATNDGPNCHTITDPPAIYPRSFAVGATTSSDELATYSSRGDVTYGGETLLKPAISAPGSGVRSSVPGNGYGSKSGTSMAGPHVAGVAALLMSAAPDLRGQPEMAQAILEQTADAKIDTTCGGDADGHPNNSYGWGIVNAQTAIESLSQPAALTGIVTDGLDGTPVVDATVTLYALADLSTPLSSTLTDGSGQYDFTMAWGSYQIVVSKDAYETKEVAPIYAVGGRTASQDVVLDPRPDAVQNLSIEIVGGDVVLQWQHLDATVVRYEIWRSSAPYAGKDDPAAMKIGEAQPGQLNEMVSFTDTDDTLGDPAAESTYIVYAVNSLGVFSTAGQRVAEREFELLPGSNP